MESQELKARRIKLEITQRCLSILLAVTQMKVWNWENERTKIPEKPEQALEIIEAKFNKQHLA